MIAPEMSVTVPVTVARFTCVHPLWAARNSIAIKSGVHKNSTPMVFRISPPLLACLEISNGHTQPPPLENVSPADRPAYNGPGKLVCQEKNVLVCKLRSRFAFEFLVFVGGFKT